MQALSRASFQAPACHVLRLRQVAGSVLQQTAFCGALRSRDQDPLSNPAFSVSVPWMRPIKGCLRARGYRGHCLSEWVLQAG